MWREHATRPVLFHLSMKFRFVTRFRNVPWVVGFHLPWKGCERYCKQLGIWICMHTSVLNYTTAYHGPHLAFL